MSKSEVMCPITFLGVQATGEKHRGREFLRREKNSVGREFFRREKNSVGREFFRREKNSVGREFSACRTGMDGMDATFVTQFLSL